MRLTLLMSILISLSVDNIVRAATSVAHCQRTDVPVELLREQVNVVYTMSHRCHVCYEEANTLPSLKREMAMRGIEINVVAGISRPPRWIGASGQTNILPSVKQDYGRVWTALGKENGHVFILDKCGRLIFHVITPWAMYMYPYVKAAILSTQHDNPCGPCSTPLQTGDDNSQNEKYPPLVSARPIDDLIVSQDGTVPLRVVFPKRHTHAGSPTEYHAIELQTGNPSYHGHPDEEESPSPESTTTRTRTDKEEEENRRAVTERPKSMTRQAQQRLKPDEFSEFESEPDPVSEETGDRMESTEYDEEDKEKLKAHYGSLLTWLKYV